MLNVILAVKYNIVKCLNTQSNSSENHNDECVISCPLT